MRKLLLLSAILVFNLCHADNWMAGIDGNTRLCRMSIPGTHDAGTGNGFSGISVIIGAVSAKTQDLSLSEQWDCGVRAFDLRPALKNGKLKIYHGIVETKLTFDDALGTICKKLEANPSECAIVLMQNEGDADVNEWGKYVTESMNKVRDYLIDYTPGMTLDQARGKLLIMNRNLYRPIPYGCVLQGWGDKEYNRQGSIESANGRWSNFHVQDFYDVTASGATELKNRYIEDMLNQSSASTNDHFYFNFTSGYTVSAIEIGIYNNAKNTNTFLANLLEDGNHSGCCTGIVFMDYAGVDRYMLTNVNGKRLVNAVINCNPKTATAISSHQSCSSAAIAHDISGKPAAGPNGVVIRNGKKYIK